MDYPKLDIQQLSGNLLHRPLDVLLQPESELAQIIAEKEASFFVLLESKITDLTDLMGNSLTY